MSGLTIDQLPDLCLRRIFSFLSWCTLRRCRTVCSLFKFYADQTEVTKLYVIITYPRRGNPGTRPIDTKNTLSFNKFSTLNPFQYKLTESQIRLLQQVKFLHVTPPDRNRTMYTDVLNQFKQLVQLEIKNTHGEIHRFIGQRELSLPNLRVLNLTHQILDPPVLNTPKLEVLRNKEIQKLPIKYPETIKRLESNYPGKLMMAKFKNVEVFSCELSDALLLSKDLSSVWKNLRELNIDLRILNINPYFYNLSRQDYERFGRSLREILNQRAILGREELKVYWRDVLLVDDSQLEDYDLMADAASYQIKYYYLLRVGYSSNVTHINYNDLVGQRARSSSDFFKKFPSIQSVNVIGPVERDLLEWFLGKTSKLSKLNLTNTWWGQEFLAKLPNLLNRPSNLLEMSETISVNIKTPPASSSA